MSSAIEVLKSKKSICDLCKYDNGKSCDASGGEFNECKPADDFYKAIQEAIVALEKQKSDKILFLTLNKENAEFRKERAKLKEWLEKEIKGKEMLKVHLQYQAKESIEIEINQLKEVLERVGEQK